MNKSEFIGHRRPIKRALAKVVNLHECDNRGMGYIPKFQTVDGRELSITGANKVLTIEYYYVSMRDTLVGGTTDYYE